MPETLIDALVEAAEVRGLGVTFWDKPGKSEHLPYSTILEDALRVAYGLREKGLVPGERVAIILPTGPDFYRSFYGVLLAGGVPTALYPPLRLGRVEEWKERTTRMLVNAEAVGLITSNTLMGMCGTPVTRANPRLVILNTSTLAKRDQTYGSVEIHREDLAAVQFSSGSTGNPKAVALTHGNMLSNARAIVDSLPGDWNTHSCVSWLPLYHDMGLIGCMISAMVAKCPLTLLRPERFVARPHLWLQAISETKATISVAPNFAFGLATNRIKDRDLVDVDLSTWQIALCGAEPVHRSTLENFAERFSAIGFEERALTPVYGLAEATLAVTFSSPDEPPVWKRFDSDALVEEGCAKPMANGRDLASVGKPLPGVSVSMRSATGHELPEGRVGNVWVKGPGIMKGYLDCPEANAEIFDTDGWLNTGDTGFLFEGELFLCGRTKDLIIINGRNHDPALVEDSLHGLAGLRAGCVSAFALTDSESGTEGLGLVAETRVEDPGARQELECDIIARVQESTGLRVSYLELTSPGTLPRTSSGKIRRQETRKRVLAGCLSAPKSVGRGTFLKETLRGLWSQATATLPKKRSA